MDLLAALAADPTLLPLWAVLLFAAGMYPVGMMFGCSPCCGGRQCNHCTGTMPETLTVAISGIPEETKGPALITLAFSACYGSGGGGVATAPGQSALGSDLEDDRGPITAVSLADGGSGYARLGRTAPTLSASIVTSTGSGASLEMTVTKAAAPDECGLDYWEVSKIAVVDGGIGYDPWDGVQISPSEGDSAESGAVISVTLAQLPPDLTLGVSSQAGTGAELTPQTDKAWWSTPQARVWRIQSVTVDDGGDGYTHLDTVTVTRGTGTFFADGYYDDATLSLITANAEPTVGASVESTGGTGASLSVTLAETEIYPPPAYDAVPVWAVESIAVDSAGTGYAQFDTVWLAVVDGDTRSTAASAYVSEVDANGGIVAVSVYSGGEYFKGGPITAVSVVSGGGYVKRNGEIESVAVTSGGKYYREDASLPPYVASVTVNVTQAEPWSAGTGAAITATVGDDPTDEETFGKVTALTVSNGGEGYLAYQLFPNCLARFNGRSIVVKRAQQVSDNIPICTSTDACCYSYQCAQGDCQLETEAVRVDFRQHFDAPDGLPLVVSLHVRGGHSTSGALAAEVLAPDCDSIDVTAYGIPLGWPYPEIFINLPHEATARVTVGGTYEEPETCKRFTLDDIAAIYGEIQWGDLTWDVNFHSNEDFFGNRCGKDSYFSVSGAPQNTTGSWCDEWSAAAAGRTCSESRITTGIAAYLDPDLLPTCLWKWTSDFQGMFYHPDGPGSGIVFAPNRSICFGIDRKVKPENWYFNGVRTCWWCWQILEITTDPDTFFPTGVVLRDAPAFYTTGDTGAFYGNLLDQNTVCSQNPGTPTVTFSVLP